MCVQRWRSGGDGPGPARLAAEPRPQEPGPDGAAGPPEKRKAYAPPRLGEPPPLREPAPPEPTEAVVLADPLHITNLGTLLDVLA